MTGEKPRALVVKRPSANRVQMSDNEGQARVTDYRIYYSNRNLTVNNVHHDPPVVTEGTTCLVKEPSLSARVCLN
jgi:hypothetical protein